jgi:hypothetical protein
MAFQSPVYVLVAASLLRAGLALDTRLFRREHDGAARADTGSSSAACYAEHSDSSIPEFVNGDFEIGSTTDNYQAYDAAAMEGFTWTSVTGEPAPDIVRSESPDYGNEKAARDSNYLVSLGAVGSGLMQCVPGHQRKTPDGRTQWYRLIFHASYQKSDVGDCTKEGFGNLTVLVDANVKFSQKVPCGALQWYAITYKAIEKSGNVLFTFQNSGGDRPVFIDHVRTELVVPWDEDAGNGDHMKVLLQKVTCSGYPAPDTCTLGKFLTVGASNDDDLDDGRANIVFSDSANENSIFRTEHDHPSQRWSFKSAMLHQVSTSSDPINLRDDRWYVHSDYTSCEARNWDDTATSRFFVDTNDLGFHQISNAGTECGSLFVIQKFTYNPQ